MSQADISEFSSTVSKNMGEYVTINGRKTVTVVGSYVIELYRNVLSRQAQRETTKSTGVIAVSRKKATGYVIVASHMFDDLTDAKDVYRIIKQTEDDCYVGRFVRQYEI